MILKAQMQTVEDKTVISGLHWYASDRYVLQITVGGVGGDFSQTGCGLVLPGAVNSHTRVRLKVEIHEIHQNLRNPVSILSKFHALQQNPLT